MDKTFEKAQKKELSFWRHHCQYVRLNFEDPLDYVRKRIADTLGVRGMAVEDFRDKSIIEYGPGMYPMVSVLPVSYSLLIEPLYGDFCLWMNGEEQLLWYKPVVVTHPKRGETYKCEKRFDYCLLKNVLDHTTRPADLVANINADVVLVDSFVGRIEDTTLHPSAFGTPDEIISMFVKYKLSFVHEDEQKQLWYFTFEKGE